jgi:hypothetical protein
VLSSLDLWSWGMEMSVGASFAAFAKRSKGGNADNQRKSINLTQCGMCSNEMVLAIDVAGLEFAVMDCQRLWVDLVGGRHSREVGRAVH